MNLTEELQSAMRFHHEGKLADAEKIYRRILDQRPDCADALHLLGVIASQRSRHQEAVDWINRAILIQPNFAAYYQNLGVAFDGLARLDDAVAAYRKALALKPDFAEVLSNLGNTLRRLGRHREAIDASQKAIRLRPDLPEAHNNLANALEVCGQMDEAIAALKRALELRASFPEALNTLGNIHREIGVIPAAIDFYERAMATSPHRADIASSRLYAMHCDERYDSAALLREHQQWAKQFAPVHPLAPHKSLRQPDRKLRIGYVSPDFRSHVVGWNLLPLFQQHDHAQFEIFAYSSVTREDTVTAKLRSCCDGWRDIRALNDTQAAQLIRSDAIDILVDLSLHMAHNRLLLFAQKPAPVQATYLAYCSTSGLSQIDYRFSDPHLDPDEHAHCYSEKTIRLPRSYWCYQPPDAPAVGPAPLLANGFPTFGCLNSFAKASPSFLDLCAQILAKIPHSRLILYCPPGAHRIGVLRRFASHGVQSDRIDLLGKQPWADYIGAYHRTDIALDPFPHGGGITTCDALWMGVPVVTLSGRTPVGRGGRSILSNLGLPDLVAASTEEYAHLAGDFNRWIQLRGGLRERMSASPLLDSVAFARDIEQAYRQMWRVYCG